MPIDILKIDRSFVDRIEGGDELALARAIVELARSLSLATIAEGIELGRRPRALISLAAISDKDSCTRRPSRPTS